MQFNKFLIKSILLTLPFVNLTTQVQAATPKDTLLVAKNIADLITLDPAKNFEFSGGEILNNIYQRLVTIDPKNPDILINQLADKIQPNESKTGVIVTLKEDAQFSSGNKLTSVDVLYSFERAVNINGSPAFLLGELGWNAENIKEHIKIIDDSTVELIFKEGISSDLALNILTANVASIVDSKEVLSHVKDNDYGSTWLNKNSAGTGPFNLLAWEANKVAILAAKQNWWEGKLGIKQVMYQHVPESATQRLMLEKGDIDIARNLTVDQVQGLTENKDIQIDNYPQLPIYYLSFNVKHEKLNNPAIWKAARYLIDYKGMTDSFLKGQFNVHQSFWPKGLTASVTETPFSLNPTKAKEILKEAGVKDLSFSVDFSNRVPFIDVAQSLQATFKQADIDLKLVPGSGSQVLTKYRAREHEAALLYWGPDYMDPHSNAHGFIYNVDNSKDSKNKALAWRNSWSDDKMNAKVIAALNEQDREERIKLYEDLQKDFMHNSPFVILFQKQDRAAYRKNVVGYYQGSGDSQIYYYKVSKQ